MKQIYLYFALLFATTLFAQMPQGFSYQAVALNTSGNAVASSPVKIRLSILDNSAAGTAVYTETHNPTHQQHGPVHPDNWPGNTNHRDICNYQLGAKLKIPESGD